MATDRRTVQRIFVEHTEISILTTKMEHLVPDPLSLQFQIPVGRAYRCRNPQPTGLPPVSQDVNSSNNPDILSQNALHPSGIHGICLDTSLLNTRSHSGPTLSNPDAPHPPVNADFLDTNRSVPEPPANNGANIHHSFATHQPPSYATSYSNVSLQEDTAYSNFLEPQATLPTSGFDPYETNNMGGFTIKDESLDNGWSPYTVLPHQQPLTLASNSNLFSTMNAESYNGPLCPFSKIESQDLASAALNMLAEQRPVSSTLNIYGSEPTTASTGSETFIPPNFATNASFPSGWEHFGIHAPQESFDEKCLPSEMVSCNSQTGPSNSPSHGRAASLYLPKIEDFEDMGPLMDTAMQIAPETSNYNDLNIQSPEHHLFPGVCNYNTANLSDNLPICHAINDHVMQENLDSSSSSMEPPCIANDVGPNIRNIRELSTHADAPNADSDTSVEEDTRSIVAELDDFFAQITTGGDYNADGSSTRETGDVNAANPYNVNNGNNTATHDTGDVNAANPYNVNNSSKTVISEPGCSQHSAGQVIRDAGSEETQPRQKKYRPRKKANASEETQPKRRKYQPRKETNLSKETQPKRGKYRPREKTNILPAEAGHSQEIEVHDVQECPSSWDRRTDPEYRYLCIDKQCEASGEMGYRGFPTISEAHRHINTHGRHIKEKHYRCPLHHADGQEKLFSRPDGLRA